MSNIKLSNEQKLIRGEIKKFTAAELDPIAADIEKDCCVPKDIVNKISQMGLFGLTAPEQYGGSGFNMMTLCVALEELSKSCASLALMVAVNNCFVIRSISTLGSAQAKSDYLKRLSGRSIGGYIPLSDTEGGGPGLSVNCDDDEKSISGKSDIAFNSTVAEFFVVPASSGQDISLCLADKSERHMNSYSVGMMGMRGAGITGLEVKRAPFSEKSCLTADVRGAEVVESLLDYARVGFSAIALGLNEAALEASVKYSKERRQFGRAICEFPMVRDMLAEIKVSVEKSRGLVYEAASAVDMNEDYPMIARVAYLTSCEDAVISALKAIQIHGGYGYTRDYPVERYFRDAKTLQLLCGGPVDLKGKIAEEILL
jgi:butyryl-CoA dehydrogenase